RLIITIVPFGNFDRCHLQLNRRPDEPAFGVDEKGVISGSRTAPVGYLPKRPLPVAGPLKICTEHFVVEYKVLAADGQPISGETVSPTAISNAGRCPAYSALLRLKKMLGVVGYTL